MLVLSDCFSRRKWSLKLVMAALIILLLQLPTTLSREDDLYTLLGVSKSASTHEIKRAYRRKALDTHPGKNPNQQEASETFRKVVNAFQVLSDPHARKRYDTTGKTSPPQQQQQQQQPNSGWNPFQWHFQQQKRHSYPPKPQLSKDSQKVKEAKMRVMHIVSRAQLDTITLDNNGKLERHLLMCFITPSSESIMEDGILFPYPFAGMSSQGIWWEDVLQTAIVRHHTMNHELVQQFDIPNSPKTPVFVLAKKGSTLLDQSHATFATNNRIDFENWVWKQLQVRVEFHNQHSHNVELYWIDETRARLKATKSISCRNDNVVSFVCCSRCTCRSISRFAWTIQTHA